jgi:hypothetical protein
VKIRIAIGSVYHARSAWKNRWRVDAIIEKSGYPTHARLRSLSDPSDSRLIAVAALLDHASFAPAPDEPAGRGAPLEVE